MKLFFNLKTLSLQLVKSKLHGRTNHQTGIDAIDAEYSKRTSITAHNGDFWDELNPEDQSAIDEGLEQLNKGQYVPHESVRKEIKSRFNF